MSDVRPTKLQRLIYAFGGQESASWELWNISTLAEFFGFVWLLLLVEHHGRGKSNDLLSCWIFKTLVDQKEIHISGHLPQHLGDFFRPFRPGFQVWRQLLLFLSGILQLLPNNGRRSVPMPLVCFSTAWVRSFISSLGFLLSPAFTKDLVAFFQTPAKIPLSWVWGRWV